MAHDAFVRSMQTASPNLVVHRSTGSQVFAVICRRSDVSRQALGEPARKDSPSVPRAPSETPRPVAPEEPEPLPPPPAPPASTPTSPNEPADRSSGPSRTIAFQKCWNQLLTLGDEAFVEEVGGIVAPKPEGMAEILRWNQGRA